jgi:hypothetical protein
MSLEGRERKEDKKYKNGLSDNLLRPTKHVLPLEDEDITSNLMT